MNNMVVNVKDFGAKAVDGFDNTDAFQAAVDKAVDMGGATVYIPASDKWPNRYWLSRPVYINGDRVFIKGDGENATVLQTWGPAFLVAKHPRFWTTNKNSYVDTDTNQTINLKNEKGEFIFENRYKVDLLNFSKTGIYKSNDPSIPSLDSSKQAVRLFGIRPRGVVKAVCPGNLLSTGGKSGWESKKQITFDFITYAHDKPIEGGIAGAGEFYEPDSWLFSGNSIDYYLCLALTDDSLVNKATGRIKFSQPQTKGLHRVSIQLDFDNKLFAVFVDQKQVNFTFEFDAGVSLNDLFSKYNRLARWEYSDFTLGSRCKLTHANENYMPQPSDYTIIGVKCYSALKYAVNGVNTKQTRIDGQPLDDNDTLRLNDANTFAGIYNVEGTGNIVNAVGDPTHFSFGTLIPVGQGSTPISTCKISDMKIMGVGHLPMSDGITLGSYLHLTIENVAIQEGFYNSIGSLNGVVSYPLYMTNCKLYSCVGFFGVNQSHILSKNITFGYVVRCAVKLSGSGSVWQGGMTNDFESYAEAFFLGYNFGVGAGHRFEEIMIDTEGVRNSPRVAYFYYQKIPHVNNNGLYLNQVSVGESGGVPIIYLDDKHQYLQFPSFFSATNCSFGNQGKLCKVMGTDWVGEFNALRHWCADSVIETNTPTCKVTSSHKDFVAPPNQGGWSAGCHQIKIPGFIPGGPTNWVCAKAGVEGSQNPPTWIAENVNYGNMCLSGNVFSNFYTSGSANHPATGQANIRYGLLQDKSSSKILDFILNNKSFDFATSHMQFVVDPTLTSKTQYIYDGEKKSDFIPNNSSLWNDFNTATGLKTNKVDIVLNAKTQDSWPEYQNVITRPSSLFILSGKPEDPQYRAECLVSARFENQKSLFFRNGTITIPANSLSLGFSSIRVGSWQTFAQAAILNMLFGGSVSQFPASLYLGLSSTQVTNNISSATEPQSYRRIELPRNVNMFAKDASGSTFFNNVPLTFSFGIVRPVSMSLGLLKYFFLVDDKNNVWASGILNKPVVHNVGDPMPVFNVGALQIQI